MRVFKPKYRSRSGDECSTPRWHVEFTDDTGRVRRIAGFEDKAGTQELGTKLVRFAAHKGARTVPDRDLLAWVDGLPLRMLKALRRMGLVTAAVDPRRMRPLVDPKPRESKEPKDDLIADFGEVLLARDRVPKYVTSVTGLSRRLFAACGFTTLTHIDADKVERKLSSFRDDGLSVKTSNHMLVAAKEFTRWATMTGLSAVDPLARLKRLNPDVDPRRIRRALTFKEISALVQAAHDGQEHRGVSGPTRALVWRLASEAGLRVGEIQSLQVRDLDLGPAEPALLLRAAVTKNRREVRQPIKPDLARDLAPYCAGKLPARSLLPLPSDFKTKTPLWLKVDLTAAGILYRDASDRVADCHSLRSSYVTELVRRGVNAKTVQTLARHATPSMTLGIYARLGSADERNALGMLPSIAPGRARATGTDGHLAGNLADGAADRCSPVRPTATTNRTDEPEDAASAQGPRAQAGSRPAAPAKTTSLREVAG